MVISILFAGIASCAFSVLFGVRGQHILYAGIDGLIGYTVYLLVLPLGSIPALLLASASLALFAEITARVRKAPATVFLAAGLIPLVPGGGIYNSVLKALEGAPAEAATLLYNTLLEAGAIAVGIIIVSSLLKLLPISTQKQA